MKLFNFFITFLALFSSFFQLNSIGFKDTNKDQNIRLAMDKSLLECKLETSSFDASSKTLFLYVDIYDKGSYSYSFGWSQNYSYFAIDNGSQNLVYQCDQFKEKIIPGHNKFSYSFANANNNLKAATYSNIYQLDSNGLPSYDTALRSYNVSSFYVDVSAFLGNSSSSSTDSVSNTSSSVADSESGDIAVVKPFDSVKYFLIGAAIFGAVLILAVILLLKKIKKTNVVAGNKQDFDEEKKTNKVSSKSDTKKNNYENDNEATTITKPKEDETNKSDDKTSPKDSNDDSLSQEQIILKKRMEIFEEAQKKDIENQISHPDIKK
jgi:hypothetical protein